MKHCENTLTVPYIKDVPKSINGMTKIAILHKDNFDDIVSYYKDAKEYYKLKTLILNLDEDSQKSNYGALYVRY